MSKQFKNEFLASLDQEAAEQILLAYEGGIPPPDRYLPYLLVGVQEIFDDLSKVIHDLRKSNNRLSVVFLTSERGGGKTSVAIALKTLFQDVLKGYNVPVILDFNLHNNVVSFTKSLYFKMLFGSFQIPEVEIEDQDRLIESAVNFSVQLNAFLINPRLLQDLPQNYIKELAKFIADTDGVLYVVLDEVDRFSQLDPSAADNLFFIMKNIQDVSRLPKMYVFCTTRESLDWLKSSHYKENAFLSRIFNNPSLEKNYILSYDQSHLNELIGKVIQIQEKAKKVNFPSNYRSHLLKLSTIYSTPRHLIGATMSLLNDYLAIKPILDDQITRTGFLTRRSSIDIGNILEKQLKPRVLPILSQIYPNFLFDPNPPTVRSYIQPQNNRKADGQITLPDTYMIFIEIKYSEARAQLNRDHLDQIVSYFF